MPLIQYVNWWGHFWCLPSTMKGGATFRMPPLRGDPPDGLATTFLFTIFGFGICFYDREEGCERGHFAPLIVGDRISRGVAFGRFKFIERQSYVS